jgi:rod shape-determining protein MreB
MHTGHAGDFIDRALIKEIQSKFNGAQITKDMARRWKEQYSFVGTHTPESPIMVDFSIEGKAMNLDITDCLQAACEAIVDPIVDNVKQLIAGSNPEYHDEFRRTMVLAGGGSGIKRLGAMGGLRLAMEVPEEMWSSLTLATR